MIAFGSGRLKVMSINVVFDTPFEFEQELELVIGLFETNKHFNRSAASKSVGCDHRVAYTIVPIHKVNSH